MTNDIRTALDILKEEEGNKIVAFVDMRNKELMHQTIYRCTMEKPCPKCCCLKCGIEIRVFEKTIHTSLHDECYMEILKDE